MVANRVISVPGRFARHQTTGFESTSTAWLRSVLSPGARVVDVGAHAGVMTVVLADIVGPTGHVVAMEPAPQNVQFLRRNVRKLGLGHVSILQMAADERSGERELRITDADDSHGFFPHPLGRFQGAIAVRTSRLDEVIEEHLGGCDLLKIDVEGAELQVLAGLGDWLVRESRPHLLVEWNPHCQICAGFAPRELPLLLDSHGYRISVLDDRHGSILKLDDVLAEVDAGRVSPDWYVNLACEPVKE